MDEASERTDHRFHFPQLENSRSILTPGLFDAQVYFYVFYHLEDISSNFCGSATGSNVA